MKSTSKYWKVAGTITTINAGTPTAKGTIFLIRQVSTPRHLNSAKGMRIANTICQTAICFFLKMSAPVVPSDKNGHGVGEVAPGKADPSHQGNHNPDPSHQDQHLSFADPFGKFKFPCLFVCLAFGVPMFTFVGDILAYELYYVGVDEEDFGTRPSFYEVSNSTLTTTTNCFLCRGSWESHALRSSTMGAFDWFFLVRHWPSAFATLTSMRMFFKGQQTNDLPYWVDFFLGIGWTFFSR